MNAVIYNRCSTSRQDLQANTESCKKWIASEGHVLVGIYEDAAVSGKNTERKALQQLFSAIQTLQFDVIVVADTSRLSRSTKDMLNLMDTLTQAGKKVYFVKEKEMYDPANPDSMFKLGLWSLFNERERVIIRQRMLDGRLNAVKKGVKLGRKRKDFALSTDEMIRLHELQNLSKWQISKLAKCSWSTVHRRIKNKKKGE